MTVLYNITTKRIEHELLVPSMSGWAMTKVKVRKVYPREHWHPFTHCGRGL